MPNYYLTLDNIIEDSFEALQKISLNEMSDKPLPEKWSKKEILGHLIDSAYNNHQRFLRAANQDELVFQGYDQDDWVIKNNYQNRSNTDILNTWYNSQRHINVLIKGIPEELLIKETTNHNFHQICMNTLKEAEPTSLSYLVWDYIFHLEHHLSQIIQEYKRTLSSYEKK